MAHGSCRYGRRQALTVLFAPAAWSRLWLALQVFAVVVSQIQKCHSKCTKCHLFDYNMEWHCLECEEGYELWVDDCALPCRAGQYRYGYNCVACTRNCLECVGPLQHECVSCKPGYVLDFRGVCVRACLNGTFPGIDGESCLPCNPYCKTCIAGSEISCTDCYDDYDLRILEPRTKSGQCMWLCPSGGFYRDAPTDLRCLSCSESCIKCKSADWCEECDGGFNLYRGYCYTNVTFSEREAVNFANFLESGAGIQWDESTAPSWELLMGSDWGQDASSPQT